MKKNEFWGFPDINGDGDVDLLDVLILNEILDEDEKSNFDIDDFDEDDDLDEDDDFDDDF